MASLMRRDAKFYVRYVDLDGTERTRLLRGVSTLTDARQMVVEIERRIMSGRIGIEKRVEESPEEKARRTITVVALGEQFTEKYTSAKVKNIKTYRREAANVLARRVYPYVGKLRAQELSTKQIDHLVASLSAEEYAGSSVRSALAALSRMFVWGRKMGLIACDNPVKGAERPSAASSIEFLSRDEAVRLLEYLEGLTICFVASPTARSLHPLIAFCLYTGVRKGEAMGLRWQDVQLDAGRVDVVRSYGTTPKNGKTRHVPLNAELVRILRRWRDRDGRDDGGLVFPVGDRMGRREEVLELGAAYDAAGVTRPAKPWHCLRHTFASHFMMAGGNILTLQKLLGHATVTMTMRYSHLAPDFLKAEVARMSFAATKADVVSLDEARRYCDGMDGHAQLPGVVA